MGRMKDLLITIYNGGDEAVEAAQQLAGLSEIVPQDDEPGWIPVEERLPSDLELVLVNHEGTGIEMAARQPNGEWVICWTGFKTSGVAYTHWMPLPSPPSEGIANPE